MLEQQCGEPFSDVLAKIDRMLGEVFGAAVKEVLYPVPYWEHPAVSRSVISTDL